MLWVVLMILPLLASKSTDELLYHTPDDAVSVVTVNNRKIIERFLFDALYAKGFTSNELDQLDYKRSNLKMPSSGIDLRHNIVVFQTNHNNATITGFIVNLISPKDFSDFELRDKNEIKYFDDNIGCILLLPEEFDEKNRLYFEQYAKDVVVNRKKELPDHLKKSKSDGRLINLFYRGHESTYIQNLQLSARVEGASIHFKGRGEKNPMISYESGTYTQIVSPGQEPYLEVRAGQLPDSLYSYFDVVTNNLNIHVPKVTSQQIYFYGFIIDNIDGSTAFLPKFDGVFRFKDSINLSTALDSLSSNQSKVRKKNEKCVEVGELRYYFQQISPYEVVAGITELPKLEKLNRAPLPLIKGNPAATLNFEGEGIIAQIAQMLPPVKYSKKLFNDLEYFEIHTENGNEGMLKIEGEMRFPNKQKASLEIFKYLMKF